MSELLKINDKEVEHLAWIHSNKFTIPDVFGQRFFKSSYRYACRVLRKYYLNKSFLHMVKAESTTFQDSIYSLTAGAIRSLDARNKILVRSTKYPVKVNPYEREHDIKVQEIRTAIELSLDLKEVFWVSDFEMRSGISPLVKARFVDGSLDKEKWRSNGMNPNNTGRRTPDGYFEADLEGQRESFVLEFEHHPYDDFKFNRMIWNLKHYFSEATKLVVSANRDNAERMIKALQSKVKSNEQTGWFVSDLEKIKTTSFKDAWHQVAYDLD